MTNMVKVDIFVSRVNKFLSLGMASFFRQRVLRSQSRLTQSAPDPRKNTETMVVGVCAFSGSLRSLKLIPSKWHYLVPPTSG
jgi:hypothetical protein